MVPDASSQRTISANVRPPLAFPTQEEDPMMNFTERDLLRHAVDAGFAEVHVELAVDVEPGSWVLDWDRLLALAPNPNAPTAGETIREALTSEEAERFEAHLRPLADSGNGVRRSAFAYLTAAKL
jgi:arsenite methyltransferase